MKIYIDTEFTDLLGITVDTLLISAGFVAEDGSEHYFELTNHWEEGGCSTFVLEAVLPHLDLEKHGKDPKKAIEDLNVWIESFGEPVTLCSDAPGYDWGLLYDLFTDYGFPSNLVRRPLSVNTPDVMRGIEEYFETQPYAVRDPKNWDAHEMMYRPFAIRHHALWDARALAYGNGVMPLVLRVHCKMLKEAIVDTVELPNPLLMKMISSIRDGEGKLDPQRRIETFGMLTDDEISKIESAYSRIDDFCKTENDGKTLVLRGCSVGLLSRYGATKLLGFTEDEQLAEAMTAADLPLPDPANDRNSWMTASIVDAFISSIIDTGNDGQKSTPPGKKSKI